MNWHLEKKWMFQVGKISSTADSVSTTLCVLRALIVNIEQKKDTPT